MPTCPSCGAALAKMPQRKTRCKQCGEFMFIRSTPDDRTRRLMSAADAEAADDAWQKHFTADVALRRAAAWRVTYENLERMLPAEALGVVIGVHTRPPRRDGAWQRGVTANCHVLAARLYTVAAALREKPLPCRPECVCDWRPVLRSDCATVVI